ncbi:Stf0 family sulfotransferase, partial [Gluconacetobacter entanii]
HHPQSTPKKWNHTEQLRAKGFFEPSKCFWRDSSQVSVMNSTVLKVWRPIRIIYLQRRDLISQAISLYRARTTGAFFSDIPEATGIDFNCERIVQEINGILNDEQEWENYIAMQRICFLPVVYENILEEPIAKIKEIVRWMLGGDNPIESLLLPISRVQRDPISAQWRDVVAERILHESIYATLRHRMAEREARIG